jgi:hypothetical protein
VKLRLLTPGCHYDKVLFFHNLTQQYQIMKKLFLFSLLLASFATVAVAQSNGNFWTRAQAGYGFCGTGDRTGYVGNLSAGWYFYPRFKAGLGFGYAGFDNGVHESKEDNQARSLGIEANAYFHILHTNFFKIEVGAGPHVQFWDWQYRAGQNITIVIDNDITILPNERVEFDETQLGYNVSLGLIVTPTQLFEFGLWGVHQNGSNGNNISTIRAGIGFRL